MIMRSILTRFRVGLILAAFVLPSLSVVPATDAAELDQPISGRKLKIRDNLDPTRRKITWDANDGRIMPGPNGGDEDPTCNGGPSNRATIEFFSESGHGTGEIELPCEYWTANSPDNASICTSTRTTVARPPAGACI